MLLVLSVMMLCAAGAECDDAVCVMVLSVMMLCCAMLLSVMMLCCWCWCDDAVC